MMEYQRDEHRVHLIVYHLIWCPWRRRPVLTGKIAQVCRALLEQKCKAQGGISWNWQSNQITSICLYVCSQRRARH